MSNWKICELNFDGGKIWKMTFKLFHAECELSHAQKIFFRHYEVYLTNNCSSDN
jgi:hypothetical protein